MAERDIYELIEASSLGTPAARALRARVSDEAVAEVMRRLKAVEREPWFVAYERTTHPDARMEALNGPCRLSCCRPEETELVSETEWWAAFERTRAALLALLAPIRQQILDRKEQQ